MKKKLILVASPPACGKTYISQMIAKAVKHIVYLDKDDIGELVRAAFCAADEKFDMDGDFYKEKLRDAEYSSIVNIAFSALGFEEKVILNAPFGKEVRDAGYMKNLKGRVNEQGAELVLIWVSATKEICHERMKKRGSDRDTLKLQSFDDYIKNIDFTPPYMLKECGAVDELVVFETEDDESFNTSLKKTLKIISGENDA